MYNEVATTGISNSQGSLSAIRHHFERKPKLSHEDATFFWLALLYSPKTKWSIFEFFFKKGGGGGAPPCHLP